MKFGRYLLKNQVPEWSGNYISYEDLKWFIINAVRTGNDNDDNVIAFWSTLKHELEKVNNFFLYKYAEIEHIVSERYQCFHISTSTNNNNSSVNIDDEINDPYADKEFLSIMLETKDQVHKLFSFVDINKKGFTKILKKFNKKLGKNVDSYLETEVLVLPFTSTSPFIKLLDSIEHGIQEVHHQITDYKHQNTEFTRVRHHRINLTEEENVMLSNSVNNDNTYMLKELIKTIKPDLNSSNTISDLNIQVFKKTLSYMLYKACQFRAMECIKLLLNSGASVADDGDDINQRSLIHKLVIYGGKLPLDESTSQMSNGSRESHFTYFTTAFLISKSDGSTEEDTSLLSLILENIPQTEYSKVSSKDAFGRKPMHYAAVNGFKESTRILLDFLIRSEQFSLEKGFNDPSWLDNDGFTPLLYAVLRGHTTLVNCIIKMGNIKDVDAINNVTCPSSLEFTPKSQHITPATYASPSYNVSHSHKQTMLAIACKLGHGTTAKLLLAYGANPDIQDKGGEGETPLHLAARNGFVDCVKILVGLDDEAEYQNVPDDIRNIFRSNNLKKANTEIREKIYGWTPLFLSAVEGHAECVEVLIKAGANPNVIDNTGWTPYIYAVFRGHNAVKDILHPLTAFEEPSPFNSTLVNAEKSLGSSDSASAKLATSYGHGYLKQDQSLIIVNLGNISDIRKKVEPVKLYNSQISPISILPSTPISLVVSAKNATGVPAVFDFPVDTSIIDPIKFYSSNTDDVTLIFDIIPTYGIRKQFIGRATASLSSVKATSDSKDNYLNSSITVPIIETSSLEVIGEVVFEVLVIKPFKHRNLAVSDNRTHWTTTKVIGHRGLGMNKVGTNLQLGENTIVSFVTAASLGAEYIEFDVQITKDDVPIIYHDWIITEAGYDIPIHSITLQQFLDVKKRELGLEKQDRYDILEKLQNDTSQNNDDRDNRKKRSRSNSVPINSFVRSKKTTEELKGNGYGTIQAPFTTLVETFKEVPIDTGFNIEVKYPMIDEAEDDGMPNYHMELNHFVDTILKCVYDHAEQKRNIIFSSFHPDICLMLASKQPNYPVFFLTDSGVSPMADGRCNSLYEAIRFAKFANQLGIVTKCIPILQAPKLVKTVKSAGLLVFTYGSLNNDVKNVRLQKKAGVDAVIVDSVLVVRKELQQNNNNNLK